MVALKNCAVFSPNHFVALFEKYQNSEQNVFNISDDYENFPFLSDISASNSVCKIYGCETLNENVTLSDIDVRDLVTDSNKVSQPAGQTPYSFQVIYLLTHLSMKPCQHMYR